MNNLHSILLIVIIAIVTICIRFLPFWIFRNDKQTPGFINYLGKVLPFAIMGMLVVFCLKGVSLTEAPHGLPELIACVVVIGLQIWKRNTSLSIISGTVCYMIMVQLIF